MCEHCSQNNNNSQSEANPESGVTPILRNTAPVPQFSCPVWMRSLKMGSAHHWRLFWKKTSPSFRFKSHSRRSKALLKDTFGNVTSWGLLSRNYPNETIKLTSLIICLSDTKEISIEKSHLRARNSDDGDASVAREGGVRAGRPQRRTNLLKTTHYTILRACIADNFINWCVLKIKCFTIFTQALEYRYCLPDW